jgi:predicted ATPase/DNA-binding SARP family transcriptional activator
MTTAPLTIRLFGPMSVLIEGEPMPRVRARSAEWLLALLVLRHGRTAPRSWLAGTLWPDSQETQALQNLRHALLSLRKSLGSESERLQSPTRDTLTIDLEGAEVDVLRFDQAAMLQGKEEALKSAVAAYTGPLLEGCLEEWVFSERASREQTCLRALETLADAAEQRQDYGQALSWLRRAEGMDALRDTTRRALMRVLAASGDTPAALTCYRDYRLLLRQEMNVEPDEETVKLYQQIRDRARQAAHEREAARKPTPFSSVSHSASPAPSPLSPAQKPQEMASPAALSASQPLPAALPHPLTALIGREKESRDITEVLSGYRLVTLVGGGGVGKTRLAIEVARKFAADVARRVAFVELASLSDAALLPAFVAAALGIREEATSDPAFLLRALTGWFSTHRGLLVLDNCEHLIGAAAALTQTLLERCPDIRIIATSRQRLGLIGEVTWQVPSLPSPDPKRLTEGRRDAATAALQYPAVQLFVERAAMARPGFRLTDPEDGLAVARICYRLDGIPLAIELAAARVAILSVGQIASRLGERFDLLKGGSRAALPRQQTLRALIDWSYDLLSAEERALLCRLSVFAGGWMLQAAEAIAASGRDGAGAQSSGRLDVLDLLASLVDKSLVLAEDKKSRGTEPGVRYKMLETVREYAGEKLRESEGENVTLDLHLSHYLEQAQTAALALAGSNPEPAVSLLDSEVDNLRVALAWAQAHAPNPDAYLRLATALWPFWEIRGFLTEGRVHLRAALSLTQASDDPLRAQALRGATILALAQSDVDEALACGQECLERFRSLEDMHGIASAMLCLGEAYMLRQDLVRAMPLLLGALDCSYRSEWLTGVILLTLSLGKIHMNRHEMERARAYMEEAQAQAEALGDPRMLARAYRDLGVLEIEEGDHTRARTLLEQSLEIRVRLGDRMGIAYTLGCLGDLERYGDITRAIAYCQEEMAVYRELGNVVEMGHALHRMGNLCYLQGDYEAARQAYAGSLGLLRSLQSETGFAYVRVNLGNTLFHLGDPAGAMKLYREALPLYRQAQYEEGIVWSLERIGIVEAMYGDSRKAARLLGAAFTMRERLGVPQSPADRQDWDEALGALKVKLRDETSAAAHDVSPASSYEPEVEGDAPGKAVAIDASWREGRAMTQELAIRSALSPL